jgi:sortase B
MGDGKMFAELTYYKRESFAKAVPSFYFSTLTDEYDCYVFSAYNVYPDNWRLYDITFEDDADFMDFVGDALERSVFDFGVEVTAEDKIISLSTCDYVYKNARMLVHAVLRRR